VEEHQVQTASHEARQLLAAGPARRGHGCDDPAAFRRDLGVRPALEALVELVLPEARPGEVRVGVDEPRESGLARTVEDGLPGGRGVAVRPDEVFVAAGEGDPFPLDPERGVRDPADAPLRLSRQGPGPFGRRERGEVPDGEDTGRAQADSPSFRFGRRTETDAS
jgi:hypothetical protein